MVSSAKQKRVKNSSMAMFTISNICALKEEFEDNKMEIFVLEKIINILGLQIGWLHPVVVQIADEIDYIEKRNVDIVNYLNTIDGM